LLRLSSPAEGPTSAADTSVVAEVRGILARALDPEQRDDRFDPPWPGPGIVAAVEQLPGGYLGGTRPADTASADADTRWSIEGLLVSPGDRGLDRATALWSQASADLLDARSRPPDLVELWGRPALPWHQALAHLLGLEPNRQLLQLRSPLPVDRALLGTATVETRPFDRDRDLGQLREVNNRAFAWHPDQGGQSDDDLLATMSQPWFRADGLRVADDPSAPGKLLGFCWTKIHPPTSPSAEALGEIYVIAVDPDHHGKGLGGPLTAAGLDWLVAQGLETAMLYVEADNDRALAVYRRLGFDTNRTDRSWLGPWPDGAGSR
jgi:mycothiol synthase